MEFLKKLFNFSDTISGTDFLIRWVASNILQVPGGMLMGVGIGTGVLGFTLLGLIIATTGIALQFSTLSKRARALFSKPNYLYFYIAYLVVSIFQGFAIHINEYVSIASQVVMLGMFLYAIFKNSGITDAKHLG